MSEKAPSQKGSAAPLVRTIYSDLYRQDPRQVQKLTDQSQKRVVLQKRKNLKEQRLLSQWLLQRFRHRPHRLLDRWDLQQLMLNRVNS